MRRIIVLVLFVSFFSVLARRDGDPAPPFPKPPRVQKVIWSDGDPAPPFPKPPSPKFRDGNPPPPFPH